MSFVDISRGFGRGVGQFVGTTRRVLSWPGSALKKTKERLYLVSSSARVRAIVTEELIRLIDQEELLEAKLEQRLQVIAETVLALQKRLDELNVRDSISQADILDAMSSLKAADSLTNDERVLLANVFRENVALQKPELVGTATE